MIIIDGNKELSKVEKDLLKINSPACKCSSGVFVLLPDNYISKGSRHMQCRVCGVTTKIN